MSATVHHHCRHCGVQVAASTCKIEMIAAVHKRRRHENYCTEGMGEAIRAAFDAVMALESAEMQEPTT